MLAVVFDFRNHLCCLFCIFSILSMSRLKCGDHNCTACSRCGRTGDLYNGRISSLFFVPEISGNEPQYFISRFAAVLSLFLPLEVFGDDDF